MTTLRDQIADQGIRQAMTLFVRLLPLNRACKLLLVLKPLHLVMGVFGFLRDAFLRFMLRTVQASLIMIPLSYIFRTIARRISIIRFELSVSILSCRLL